MNLYIEIHYGLYSTSRIPTQPYSLNIVLPKHIDAQICNQTYLSSSFIHYTQICVTISLKYFFFSIFRLKF